MKDTLSLGEELRIHGLKATKNRLAILEYLRTTKVHPSAEMIQDYLNKNGYKFSVATVYNILNVFVDEGLARKVNTNDENTRYDGNTDFHIHLYNKLTKEIFDLEDENFNVILKEKLEEIREEKGSSNLVVLAEI